MTRFRARPHPLELALDRPAAGARLLLLAREARLLLLEPGGVVAAERDAAAAVELENPARDVVEEVAVVGDRDDRALVVGQEALEPGDGLRVQVIRGLVEQQEIGRLQEQPAERHAPPFSAGERRDVLLAGREPERVRRVVEQLVEAPGVVSVDRVLNLCLLGEQRVEVGLRVGEARRDVVEAVEQVSERADAVLDVPTDVLRLVELRLLRQQADRRAGCELGDSGGRLVEPGHDPQQRGLAGAVRPQHADLGAGQEGEGDVGEHLPVRAVELVDPVHGVDVLLVRLVLSNAKPGARLVPAREVNMTWWGRRRQPQPPRPPTT